MLQVLKELGQALRAERERRELSVEQVAEGLKISTRILYALEAGDVASLPHIVYTRGFASAYAKYLDLDVHDILAKLDAPESEGETPPPAEQERKNLAIKIPPINLPVIIAFCVCVAVGGAIWYYRDANLFSSVQSEHLSTAQPAPATPTKQRPPQKDEKAKKTEQKENKKATPKIDEKKVTEKKTTANKSAPVAGSEKPKKEENIAQGQQAQTLTPTHAPQEHVGPHRIIITATQAGSIESDADNTGGRRFSVKAGDTFALTFDTSLNLKLSNAGGIRIRYNGVEMPALGKSGESKTIQFPPSN